MKEPLAQDIPGFQSIGVPEQFRDHPLLSAGPYFTLPSPLLQQVLVRVGADRFDAGLLDMEDALSAVCQDHDSQVGFWRGHSIGFLLLRPKNDLANDFFIEAMAEWGKNEVQAQRILGLAGERLDWMADVRRGYCGWLMTNREFLDEHHHLFHKWENEVTEHGIPRMGPVVRDAKAVPGSQVAKGSTERFVRAFEDFFIRWRLEGMPATFLPQPMGTHLPVVDLRPVLGHMRQGGTTFYIPDICPVPSRDSLRNILEEALRKRSAPDHLAEWFQIVQSDSVAKNQISRYARIFEIQHYLRTLYARHETALNRKKSALTVALAEYFGVSDDSIERDLTLIARRIGAKWYLPPT